MMQDLNHKHILVRAVVKNPPMTTAAADAFLLEMIEAVDMKVLMGPYSTFCETEGNVGVTSVVCIETSHSSLHSWHEADEPFIQMDLYSCKDFSSETYLKMVDKHFEIVHSDFVVIDRNCTGSDAMFVTRNI